MIHIASDHGSITIVATANNGHQGIAGSGLAGFGSSHGPCVRHTCEAAQMGHSAMAGPGS